MDYKKCLVQVDEVLNCLSKDDLNKIPYEIRDGIKKEKDKNYVWKYDESKGLIEQNLSRESIAILSHMNMEYLVTEEQKEFLIKMHAYNQKKKRSEKN